MYQALYRKYRPKNFDSVYGQNIIVKTLKNSIIHNNFSHAYLFYGPRGTGKTTFSKIFARNINCLDPIDGSACGKCKNCLISFSHECVDIIEIDAASNNGVDEIRELKSKINIVPSDLKYKVYIIDEVHMLTDSSFNALLKTLEEPPNHVVFILATTDPQKIPDTIVSRCQCFSFQPIPTSIINECLKNICSLENISIDSETINAISVFSEGGLRDALGMLDKLLSFCEGNIKLNDFIEINGFAPTEVLKNFLSSIISFDVSSTLLIISNFDKEGKNLVQIMSQLLDYSRNILVDYYISGNKCDFDIDMLLKFSFYLNEKMFDIKKSYNIRVCIEITILNFISLNSNYRSANLTDSFNNHKNDNSFSFSSNISNDLNSNSNNEEIDFGNNSNFNKLNLNSCEADDDEFDFSKEFDDNVEVVSNDKSSSDINNITSSTNNNSDSDRIINIDEIMNARVNNAFVNANKDLLNKEKIIFENFRDYSFDSEIGYLVCALLDSSLRVVSKDYIILSYEFDSSVEQNCLLLHKLEDVYKKITGNSKKIAIVSDSFWEKIKKDYISNLKNGYKYQIVDEPKELFEVSNNHDIISNNAVDLFGDIVEIE